MRLQVLALGGLLLGLQVVVADDPPGKGKGKEQPAGPAIEDRIPADAPAELRALLKQHVETLRGAKEKAADRVRSAGIIGELGDKGRPAARSLCEVMLDRRLDVRTAAADALKKVAPELHNDAVELVLKWDGKAVEQRWLTQIGEKKSVAEPLTPLLASVLVNLSKTDGRQLETTAGIHTLASIAPDDIGACKLVISALTHKAGVVRNAAVSEVCRMKHKRLAAPGALALFRAEPGNLDAIRALADLADETSAGPISEAVATQRYHESAAVRDEVEKALMALKKKQK